MKKLLVGLFILLSANSFAQRKPTGNPRADPSINERAAVVVQQKLKALINGSEKDMMTVLDFYSNNKNQQDSIVQLIKQRFPKGDFVFSQRQIDIERESKVEVKEKMFAKLKQDFPDHDMDRVASAIASAYVRDRKPEKVKIFIEQIKNISSRGMAIGAAAQEIMEYDAAAADALMRPELERLASTGIPKEEIPKGRYYAFANLYGTILVKEKKYNSALKYVVQVYEHYNRKNEQMTVNYALVMNANGQYQEALPVLQKLVDESKTNAEIKKAFIESYEKVNPGESAADYLHQIELKLNAQVESSVAGLIINEAAPDFDVTDVHGKKVSLADFRGKIIVLDFWATWCGPCKASFPAMQRVVNNYKKDSSIKFLFIHTYETVQDPLNDAKKYLNDNHYNFDLYIDKKNPRTKKNDAVSAFGAKGIPAKFIIDAKGSIRFKLTGFFGSDDAAVKELSTMIETAKKNT